VTDTATRIAICPTGMWHMLVFLLPLVLHRRSAAADAPPPSPLTPVSPFTASSFCRSASRSAGSPSAGPYPCSCCCGLALLLLLLLLLLDRRSCATWARRAGRWAAAREQQHRITKSRKGCWHIFLNMAARQLEAAVAETSWVAGQGYMLHWCQVHCLKSWLPHLSQVRQAYSVRCAAEVTHARNPVAPVGLQGVGASAQCPGPRTPHPTSPRPQSAPWS
jgi:hypothetical protein